MEALEETKVYIPQLIILSSSYMWQVIGWLCFDVG